MSEEISLRRTLGMSHVYTMHLLSKKMMMCENLHVVDHSLEHNNICLKAYFMVVKFLYNFAFAIT